MTAAPLADSTRPADEARPRRLPVPACEPPFDDEVGRDHTWPAVVAPGRPAGEAPVQGTLALAFLLPSGLPAAPRPAPALHLVPDLPARCDSTAVEDLADFGPQPTSRAALPEPRAWAGRLVQAIVEVLAGDRPLTQLVRWTTTEVYEEVTALLSARRPAGVHGQASGRRAVDEVVRAAVSSVRLTEPADGVAEVAATVRRGRRTTAVALRLEGLDGRWQCTALEVG
jgi:hypothetical protein